MCMFTTHGKKAKRMILMAGQTGTRALCDRMNERE